MRCTVGVELEWPDVYARARLPRRWAWSATDYTIVNSDGVANDPRRELVRYGGELNSPPHHSPEALAEDVARLRDQLRPAANYRSNLHIHVRIPGITLDQVKTIASFSHLRLPGYWDRLDALEGLLAGVPAGTPEYAGALKRLVHSRRSRHHFIGAERHQRRLAAPDLAAMLKAQGAAISAREAVNLRSLRKHGTIEFRCFAADRSAADVGAAARFAVTWCEAALAGELPGDLDDLMAALPKQAPYEHALETGWQWTNFHTNTRPVVRRRLQALGKLR